MHRPRTIHCGGADTLVIALVLTLVTVLAASHADAQSDRVDVGGSGLAFDLPAAWSLSETVDDGAIGVTLEAPDGGVIVINAISIDAEVQREIAALGSDAVFDTWEGFVEEVPSARIERVAPTSVAGRSVNRIDFVGDGFGGSVLVLLGDGVLVTIVALAPDAAGATLHSALDGVLGGLHLRAASTATSGNPLAAADGGNPLAAPTGGNPLAAADGGNPLAAAVGGNPLARASSDGPTSEAAGRASAAVGVGERGPVYVEPFTTLDADVAFGGVLDVGRDGAWTGALTGDAYVLHNDTEPNTVRYYFANTLPGVPSPLSRAQVGVDVVVQPGTGFVAAGLVFDFDPDRGTYIAFAVTADGVAVLRNAGSGLEMLVDEPSDAVITGGMNRIEVRPQGTDVAVIVNGRSTMTLQGTAPFEGGVGILAIGAGTFTFRDLVVDAR